MDIDQPAQHAEPDSVDLPHFVVDNLPDQDFGATVGCKFGNSKHVSAEQFCDSNVKPTKVLIDARHSSPVAFNQLMTAYLSDKQNKLSTEAIVITNNALTSKHPSMQAFQHNYTVGLRHQRCKVWHDPPTVLNNSQQLSSIFQASLAGANAKIMLDSGAAANCISKTFCKLMRINIKPSKHLTVSLADGNIQEVAGTVTVSTTIQSYTCSFAIWWSQWPQIVMLSWVRPGTLQPGLSHNTAPLD